MAAGDTFVIADTGSELNRTHTVENDRGLAGTPILEQGDFSGEWTSPDLNLPNANLYLCGYCDMLRSSGGSRSLSAFVFRLDTTNQGMRGLGSSGYNRASGGADESSRHGVSILSATAGQDLQVREGHTHNGSDRVGDYDRNSGDPRGLWAIELDDTRDYLFASNNANQTASGRYGNTPRPIDLGTPSALSEGTFELIDNLTTDASQGTTITRSGGVFTVAANSKALFVAKFQGDGNSDRNSSMVRMDVDNVPYCWISIYHRNNSSDITAGDITVPVVTGGSSVEVEFYHVEQVEETVPEVFITDAWIGAYDITDLDVAILGKDDADITNIGNSVQYVSFPTADEVHVDTASFDHPSGNLTRIENNAGETITVLAGVVALWDRSSTSSSTRTWPAQRLAKSGTLLDYFISGETSRGQQSGDDQFVAGSSYAAPMELTSGQYIEAGYLDLAQQGGGDSLVLNATDGAAILFWAIRVDQLAASGTNYDETGKAFTITSTITGGDDLTLAEALAFTITSTLTDADVHLSPVEVGLSNTADPGDDTNHTLHVRMRETTADTGTVTVQLRQGSTLIQEWTGQTLTDAFADYEFNVTSASSITNYSDLRVRIFGSEVEDIAPKVSSIRLALPEAGTAYDETGKAFTITSTIGSSDTLAAAEAHAFTITSSFTAADALGSAETFAFTITSSFTTADSLAAAEAHAFTITSSFTASDLRTLTEAAGFTITSTLTPADVASFAEAAAFTVTSSFTASDLRTLTEAHAFTITSSIGSSDVAGFGEAHAFTITSTLTPADVASFVEASGFTIVSTLALSDAYHSGESLGFTITSTIGSSDAYHSGEAHAFTITSSFTAADALGSAETFAFTITSSVTSSDAYHSGETHAFTITSTIVGDDVYTSGGTNYDETGKAFTITSSVTSSDAYHSGETHAFTITSTLTPADVASFVEGHGFTITSTITSSDAYHSGEAHAFTITSSFTASDLRTLTEAHAFTITSSIGSSDTLAAAETHAFTITSTVVGDDVLSGATNYDETGKAFTITSSIGSSDSLTASEAHTFTITSSFTNADTLAGADAHGFTITSSFTTSDAYHSGEALGFTITSSFTATDGRGSAETFAFTITSSFTASDLRTLTEAAGFTITSTLTPADVASFVEGHGFTITSTFTSSDDLGVPPFRYGEGDLAADTESGALVASTSTGSLRAGSSSGSLVAATASGSLTTDSEEGSLE